ncbi:MAG: hypothetical protein ACRD26_13340 [Vicinamibacterales bacterium]
MATAAADRAGTLLSDLRRIFGDRLLSLIVYGDPDESAPLSCLALVTTLDTTDLDACARVRHSWERQGLATPLVLPEHEFRRSLDAFPLEYSEMVRAHAHVYGPDPFEGVTIAREDLRRACETQVKSHLLHVREEYIEASGRPQAIADLVQMSAPAFAALVRNVARLHGVTTSDRAAATREGARIAELPEGIVASVLALEHSTGLPSTDPARLFPEYLAAIEHLAAYIDRWRA